MSQTNEVGMKEHGIVLLKTFIFFITGIIFNRYRFLFNLRLCG